VVALDERLFLAINALVGKWIAFDRLMAFLVNDYFVILLLSFLLLALWFWGANPQERFRLQSLVLWTAAGIALTSLMVKLSNIYLPARPRPFSTFTEIKLLFYQPHDPSFPSNSAAICFAVATGIWLGHRKAGVIAYVLAVTYGFSRVFAGVHYVGDVIGGVILGSLCVLVTYWVFKKLGWLPRAIVQFMRILRLA